MNGYQRPPRSYINYPIPTQLPGLLDDWNLHNPYQPMFMPTQVPTSPGYAGDPVNVGLLGDPQPPMAMNPTDTRLAAGTQTTPMAPASVMPQMATNFLRLGGMMGAPEERLLPPPSAPPVGGGGRQMGDITAYLRGFKRKG